MTEEKALMTVDHTEFGLDETRAKEVATVFVPMIAKMHELEKEYLTIKAKDITKVTVKEAHTARMKYVKVRTETAEIHKKAKKFYRAGGLYVDAWKNTQLFASQGIEEELQTIEDHFVNIEKERISNLAADRKGQLLQYLEDTEHLDLGNMADDVWENFFSGTVASYNAKIEAERKAEEDRLAKEKEDAAEQERQRLENERLKREADAHAAELQAEKDKAAAIQAKADAEKKEADDKLAAERKERDRVTHEAAIKAGKAVAEKEEAEKKLAAMITCPSCGHKFDNK